MGVGDRVRAKVRVRARVRVRVRVSSSLWRTAAEGVRDRSTLKAPPAAAAANPPSAPG